MNPRAGSIAGSLLPAAAAKTQAEKSSARRWSEVSWAELIRPDEEKRKEKRLAADRFGGQFRFFSVGGRRDIDDFIAADRYLACGYS